MYCKACIAAVVFTFALVSGSISNAAPKPASPAPQPPPSTPSVQGMASSVAMTFVDPKTGKILWTAVVKRVEAASQTKANEVFGTLHEVDGRLYQNSIPADRLLAPTVTVDNATQVVNATGGVKVVSLTQANTQVTCDRMVYYAGKGKIVGYGNVVFRKGGFTQTGPSFAADVKLKAVVMPAPGTDGGSGHIHAEWSK